MQLSLKTTLLPPVTHLVASWCIEKQTFVCETESRGGPSRLFVLARLAHSIHR